MVSVTTAVGSIGITEEHRDLAAAVRGWLAREVPPSAARARLDAGPDEDRERPAFWKDLARQGLLADHLDAKLGGADAGLPALAVVVEETGRAMVPGPFLPTVLAQVILATALGERGGGAVAPDIEAVVRALAEGEATAAVGLSAGTLVAEPADSSEDAATAAADGGAARAGAGDLVLTGSTGPVMAAAQADWLLLTATGPGGGPVHLLVAAGELTVAPLTSLDRTRGVADVTAERVRVAATHVIPATALSLDDLAALLGAAEAVGIADWCTRTAAEYAKVRVQFGQPIGRFQGTKHRCAHMVSRTEQARSAVWDAAHAAQFSDNAALPIAIAAALALDAAVECAKDCVQVLGGIGFTWEHDAHLYLRRALTLRQILGPTSRRRADVARLVRESRRRELEIDLPEEAEVFRDQARAAFAAVAGRSPADQRRALADTGYAAPHLPAPYGLGAGPVQQIVVAQEQAAAKVRLPDLVIGNWAVPTIVKYGTDEQRERFVLPTLRGDIVWCQLFSEPGAGSDLAALTTKATRVEGGWRLDGQKVWTSLADLAQWAICIARTSPDKPKHEGITYFLVDMRSPGVDVRPLRELTGASMFNEVFLDGVFVPDALVVGEVDGGWPLARNTLGNERVSLASGPVLGGSVEGLLAAVAALPEADGADGAGAGVLADRLGALVCQAQSSALLGLRTTLRQIGGLEQGPEASIRKLVSMRLAQDAAELGLELLGPLGATEEPGAAHGWTSAFLSSRCLTIAGGTTEVQLNVIAERILGLPRD